MPNIYNTHRAEGKKKDEASVTHEMAINFYILLSLFFISLRSYCTALSLEKGSTMTNQPLILLVNRRIRDSKAVQVDEEEEMETGVVDSMVIEDSFTKSSSEFNSYSHQDHSWLTNLRFVSSQRENI